MHCLWCLIYQQALTILFHSAHKIASFPLLFELFLGTYSTTHFSTLETLFCSFFTLLAVNEIVIAMIALSSWVGRVLLYLIWTGMFHNIIYCVNFLLCFPLTKVNNCNKT